MKSKKRTIIILAIIICALSLLSGIFPSGSFYRAIYQFGVPLRLVRFVASIFLLVFCIFVDKKPELTVIPKSLMAADTISFLVRMGINISQWQTHYSLRAFLRDTMFEDIDLILLLVFLIVYFLSIRANIRNHAMAITLTVIFGIISCLPGLYIWLRDARTGLRTLVFSGVAYAADVLTVFTMILCVIGFSRHVLAKAKVNVAVASEVAPVAAAAASVSTVSEQTSHAPSSSLFESDYLIVDEKIRGFKFGSAYGIYADGEDPVGFVQQVNISGGAKAAQIMLGRKMRAMQSMEFVITDASGKRVGGISRRGMSFISIEDASGNSVGRLKFGKLVTEDGRTLASTKAKGLTKISVLDENGEEIATIDHKWNGVVKSLLTSADKYLLLFASDLDPAKKAGVLAISIAFDFVTD